MTFPCIISCQALHSWRCLQALTILYFTFMASVTNLQAEESLEVKDTALFPGINNELAIQLNNEDSYTAFQLDITFPEGISFIQTNSSSNAYLSNRASTSHSLILSTLGSGKYRVLVYSSNNEPFTGNSGDLLFLTLYVDPNFFSAPNDIEISNILFTTTSIKELQFQNLIISLDDATSINDIQESNNVLKKEKEKQWFTPIGQRLSKPTKGINITNGRKFVTR